MAVDRVFLSEAMLIVYSDAGCGKKEPVWSVWR